MNNTPTAQDPARETTLEEEIREDARNFILDNLDRNPIDVLDELSTFFDGDICELF